MVGGLSIQATNQVGARSTSDHFPTLMTVGGRFLVTARMRPCGD